jgi:hypothetical protein
MYTDLYKAKVVPVAPSQASHVLVLWWPRVSVKRSFLVEFLMYWP